MEEKCLENEMVDRLTGQQLKIAFSELTDRQRQTLEAFFFQGLSFAEIATQQGEDVRNVRHHYYRGLERLRQLTRQGMRGRKIGQ
jgi:RNA polymerase sigma-70 factor, ECF subfamily